MREQGRARAPRSPTEPRESAFSDSGTPRAGCKDRSSRPSSTASARKDLREAVDPVELAMARMVKCVKLGREAEGLDFPPYPGELGKRLFENVSKEAWKQWLEHQKMLVNENRLNLADKKARDYLAQQMESHFFGTGADVASGYVPRRIILSSRAKGALPLDRDSPNRPNQAAAEVARDRNLFGRRIPIACLRVLRVHSLPPRYRPWAGAGCAADGDNEWNPAWAGRELRHQLCFPMATTQASSHGTAVPVRRAAETMWLQYLERMSSRSDPASPPSAVRERRSEIAMLRRSFQGVLIISLDLDAAVCAAEPAACSARGLHVLPRIYAAGARLGSCRARCGAVCRMHTASAHRDRSIPRSRLLADAALCVYALWPMTCFAAFPRSER